MGTFRGATDPRLESFREFPQWIQEQDGLTPKTRVAMFCTGGIRCEKASSYLLQEGFEEVYHLEGGILQYLADVSQEESRWDGECYVFDRRVSVNHDLNPGQHEACRACGVPLAEQDKRSPLFVHGVSCAACHGNTSDERKERFAERQRQIDLATERGQEYLGLRQAKHRRRDDP